MLDRFRVSDVARLAMAWGISSLALIAADALLADLSASSPWRLVEAAAVSGVFGVLVRPLLVRVATAIGWLAVAAIAVAGQAVAMHLALRLVPGVEATSFWTLVAATWIAAAISTMLTWLVTAGTDDAFTAALRRFGERRARIADPDVDGVVFVQLDGMPFPVAQWALQSRSGAGWSRWSMTSQVTSAIGGQSAARAAVHLQARSGTDEGPPASGDLVVLGSGNLGLVYAREPRRLMMEDMDQRWPRLLHGLATSPGIGLVAVMSRERGPVVIGAGGSRVLLDDVVVGTDPLSAFAAHAAWALLLALQMPEPPDIYVNSTVDPAILEVHAFEGLVGAHGGALVSILERLGQRTMVPTSAEMAHR